MLSVMMFAYRVNRKFPQVLVHASALETLYAFAIRAVMAIGHTLENTDTRCCHKVVVVREIHPPYKQLTRFL